MFDFLRRRHDPAPIPAELSRTLSLVEEGFDGLAPIEEKLVELAELVQKSARAQGRIGLRLDEVERKIEGGFSEQRSRVVTPVSKDLRWDDLLDATDLLDEAARTMPEPSVAAGLRAIGERLARQLAQTGIVRIAQATGSVDGRRFRVVGTEESSSVVVGGIVRVVRAAAVRGDEVIREGEVIVARSTP